jgi:hypothetical protein
METLEHLTLIAGAAEIVGVGFPAGALVCWFCCFQRTNGATTFPV